MNIRAKPALVAQPAQGMIRHVFIFEPPVSLDVFDVWYFRHHAPECVRFFGPWLRRYETYRAMPTDDFLGKKEPTPEERPFLRWVFVMRYPDGVALEDGEKWYLTVHTQEAKRRSNSEATKRLSGSTASYCRRAR